MILLRQANFPVGKRRFGVPFAKTFAYKPLLA